MLSLDIGCGPSPRGDVGLDLYGGPGVVRHDLCDFPWPFASNSFDRVTAYDVLEHVRWSEAAEHEENLPRLFREVHRVLRGGGVFEIQVPHVANWSAVGIPTHRRVFNEYSFRYFADGWARGDSRACRAMPVFRSCRVTVERRFPGSYQLRSRAPPVYRVARALHVGRPDVVRAELVK